MHLEQKLREVPPWLTLTPRAIHECLQRLHQQSLVPDTYFVDYLDLIDVGTGLQTCPAGEDAVTIECVEEDAKSYESSPR